MEREIFKIIIFILFFLKKMVIWWREKLRVFAQGLERENMAVGKD